MDNLEITPPSNSNHSRDSTDPKASIANTIKPGTVLFKGFFAERGIYGTAYTFKAGCEPAPYMVLGSPYVQYHDFVLTGLAPVRDRQSCAVIGVTTTSTNASLRFEPAGGYGE